MSLKMRLKLLSDLLKEFEELKKKVDELVLMKTRFYVLEDRVHDKILKEKQEEGSG